jgi:glycerol-3-phosphate acyltransferase PlsX
LLDVGANVDSRPEHLVQFAVMGEVYYRATFSSGHRRPRVGLLSVGAEEIKGNELTREVYTRLKKSTVHFVGNVEGGDLFSGDVDVIVCDGFIGNVALKICEGLALNIFGLLKKSLKSSLVSQVGAVLSQGAFKGLRKTIDYTEQGGAPLLGVRGVCVIGHGRSNANAVKTPFAWLRVSLAHAQTKKSNRSSRWPATCPDGDQRENYRQSSVCFSGTSFAIPGHGQRASGEISFRARRLR